MIKKDTLIYVSVNGGLKLASNPERWVNTSNADVKKNVLDNIESVKNLCDCEVEIELDENGKYLSIAPVNYHKEVSTEDFKSGDKVEKETPSFIEKEEVILKKRSVTNSQDNYFKNNSNIHVKPDTKYGGLNYLSWSSAWTVAKRVDPKCNYVVHEFEGKPYCISFKSVMVKVSVSMCDVLHDIWLPVMDNKYKSKPISEIDSRDISDTIMRALVKCLALHGIGTEMYSKDGLPEDENDK